jgi:feruloyl esterase
MVFENQNWDFKSLNVERDLKIADQKFAAILNATNPDLKAFKKRGGKLIIYHGWNDAAIPAEMSINYYSSVTRKMGQGDSGAFIRLYMIPGMHHCAEGPGPNRFGQTSNCLSCDATQDIKMALEQWVEKGVAPNSIIATKYENEFRQTDIVRTRPLCPYPQVARYKGGGSIDDAANFACVNPK